MKKFSIYLLLMLFISAVYAAEIPDLNGGFEKINRSQKIAMPMTWHKNKNVTRNAAIELCTEPSLVHSGKSALYIESEKNGRAYVFRSPMIEYHANNEWLVSVYARGKGKLRLGFVFHGFTSSPKNNVYLSSVSSPNFNITDDKFVRYTWKFKLSKYKKNQKEYTKFMLMPFIDVNGDAVVYVDDYKIEKIEK